MDLNITPCKRKLGAISTPSPKRVRKDLTLKDKINLIDESEKLPKVTQKELSVKFGIGTTTVSDILKRKEFYRKQFKEDASSKRQRFISESKFGDLNETVFKWFQQARSKNIPISGPIIQEKALQFARELGYNDFKASSGWLDSWKSRFNIGHFKICGESADVDLEKVNEFKEKIPGLIVGYSNENIFNCDESGLFFRSLPDTTFAKRGEECKGGKNAKERVTVMFACSLTGEKLKPLVIGKSAKPRCFKNVKMERLPVIWEHNKKSWMTTDVFCRWIKQINDQMRKKGRKILMFLDNASSHADMKMSNVKLEFFPANCTSKLQPLDLGIIRATKARYRKMLMRRLLSCIDDCHSASELTKQINVLDCVNWVAKAWQTTKESTIQACFAHAGFGSDVQTSDDSDSDAEDDIPLAHLQRSNLRITDSDLNEMDRVEENIPIEETYEGEWEEQILSEHGQKDKNVESDSDAESDDDIGPPPPKCANYFEVLECLSKIENFALDTNDRLLPFTRELKSITEIEILKQKSVQTQATIDSYFQKK